MTNDTKSLIHLDEDDVYLFMTFVGRLKSLSLPLAFTVFGFVAKAQDFTDPVVYNNYLINEQASIISKSLEYMSFSIHSEDYTTIEKMRVQLISDIGRSMNKVNRMPDFRGTSRLKRETLDVFGMYRRTYQTDLIEVLGMKKKYNNSFEALQAYLDAEQAVEDKLNRAIEQLSKAQEAFAKKYDLKISGSGGTDGLSTRVDEISQLSDYTRAVFLEYFHVSRRFNDMVSILHERDHKKLNKRRLEVLESSKEALVNLRRTKRFNNEKEYMNLTVDLVEYFQTLCRVEFAKVALIFEKDAMDQDDANYVNKVFADYNANVELLVYNWNHANQDLWRKYIK